MPKLKTRKCVTKRFRLTAKKKIMRRRSNQNHFNARQTSKIKKLKRTDQVVEGKIAQNIIKEMN